MRDYQDLVKDILASKLDAVYLSADDRIILRELMLHFYGAYMNKYHIELFEKLGGSRAVYDSQSG